MEARCGRPQSRRHLLSLIQLRLFTAVYGTALLNISYNFDKRCLVHVHPVRMFFSVRLSLYNNCNAGFFVKGGQLRWAFAYSGSLPLYSLTHS